MTYADLLLGDLGVKVNRKGNAFKEFFAPYRPGEYVGVVEEWWRGIRSRLSDPVTYP